MRLVHIPRLMLFGPLLLMLCGTLHCQEAEEEGEEDQEKTVLQMDLHKWHQFYNENQKLILLFYKSKNCKKCPGAVQLLNNILGQPELPADVEVGQSNDQSLISKLGVTGFPTLVYLRDKSYAFYDGELEVEELLDWVMQASHKVLHRLDDDSFEHLTQASTGATTGDWLVAFYTEKCKGILSTMETLGIRIQGKTNVAKVNTAVSPVLLQRFKIKVCPQVILFKQGKMYRYELPKLDVASLRSFVDGFYRNSKADAVPGQKSGFDHLTENIADYIQDQVEGDNQMYIVAGLVSVCLLTMVSLLVCCRFLLVAEDKTKKKKKKE